MQYFDFSRLIGRYTSEFTALTYSEGYYNDSGDFVKGGQTKTALRGAIVDLKESVILRSAGTLTAQDKSLYMTEPLPNALKGTKVVYGGKLYDVESCSENAKFTGVYEYTLKYNSAFTEGAQDD